MGERGISNGALSRDKVTSMYCLSLTRMRSIIFALFLLQCVPASRGRAQDLQVPLDQKGKLERIDNQLERRLQLFTEYEHFLEARLFRVSEGRYLLEVLYRKNGRILRDKRPLSAEDVEQFREQVSSAMTEAAPQAELDQGGRTYLLIGTMGLSLGYYGWAVPAVLDVDDGKTLVALYMLTSGAGFFLPFLATKDVRVTDGAATLGVYGGTRGVAHGMALDLILLGEGTTARGMIGLGMLGSMVESFAFYAVADRNKMSAGTASVVGIGGDFGLGFGIGTAHLTGLLEDDAERPLGSGMLLGSLVGLLGGKKLADGQSFSRGDAFVLRSAGMLGAYLPLAVVDLIGLEEERIYTGASMAGAAAGLYLGNALVREKDFGTGEGFLVCLSEGAGGLVGAGFAYLFSQDEGNNSALYLSLSSLCAAGGFWLSYNSLSRGARLPADASSLNIRIAPEAMLLLARSDAHRNLSALSLPILDLNCRF